jgi:hypothetical protein
MPLIVRANDNPRRMSRACALIDASGANIASEKLRFHARTLSCSVMSSSAL